MDCCRLCLQNAELNNLDCAESLESLEMFLPHMSKCFMESPVLCETCMDNAKSVKTLLKNAHQTAAKIQMAKTKSSLGTIVLRSLHENPGVITENVSVCRLCLKVSGKPRIFLYENSVNILRHDLIIEMLKFCNVKLNFESSKYPVMCIDCWQLLQEAYSFKKDYLEADRKIRLYCEVFKLKIRSLENDTLHKVNLYFAENADLNIKLMKSESDSYNLDSSCRNMNIKQELGYRSKKHVKKEDSPNIKMEYPGFANTSRFSKGVRRKRYTFTSEDDRMLVRAFFEEQFGEDGPFGIWDKLLERWNELRPNRDISVLSLRKRVVAILNQNRLNGLSETEIEEIKCDVKKAIKSSKNAGLNQNIAVVPNKALFTDKQGEKMNTTGSEKDELPQLQAEGRLTPVLNDNKQIPIAQNQWLTPSRIDKPRSNNTKEVECPSPMFNNVVHSDSDDSFVDEVVSAAPSSFTPHIKAEPLSDDDEEIRIIEPNIIERNGNGLNDESDNESLPQLERMDMPPMQIKIQDFYSVDVKREELNMLTNQGETNNPVLVVEDLKTCRKISLKNAETGIYKCMQCSFETKHRVAADRHSNWHGSTKKKLYECQRCSYRISNKVAYQQHIKNHTEETLDDGEFNTFSYNSKDKQMGLINCDEESNKA